MAEFDPVVIKKGLSTRVSFELSKFEAARSLSPGILAASRKIESNGRHEEFGWISGYPTVQKWDNVLTPGNIKSHSYLIVNEDWAAPINIHENDILDDQTGAIQTLGAQLARRINVHPEKLLIDFLIKGDSSLTYDKVAFFSNPTGERKNDNLISGSTSGTSLEQLAADLKAARNQMMKFTDQNSEPLGIQGNLIVCPVELEEDFLRLTGSESDPNAKAQGTYNPHRRYVVIADPRLDLVDGNDWYLLATNEVAKPFFWSMRQQSRGRMHNIPLTKKWVYSSDYRGNMGYSLPHLAVKIVRS